MTYIPSSLFTLIRLATGILEPSEVEPGSLAHIAKDLRCYDEQGISALAFEGYQRVYKLVPLDEELRMKWFSIVLGKENVANRYLTTVLSFSKRLHEACPDVQTVVLKGLDYAAMWPTASMREFGDLDIFPIGDSAWEKVQSSADIVGFILEDGDYKHSHITFKNVTIENHHFLTGFNGSARGRRRELALQALLTSKPLRPLGQDGSSPCTNDSSKEFPGLYSPCSEFTAVFLLRHALGHFLSEGIRLRQILDWFFFLKWHADDLDWESLTAVLHDFGLLPFASLMTEYCKKYLGLHTDFPTDNSITNLLDPFNEDVFSPGPDVNNAHWWQKVPRICRRFVRMWRFRPLLDEPYARKVWNTFAFSSYLHRNPSL